MKTEEITIIARFKAKTGMEDTLKSELSSVVRSSLSEEGCLTYILHQSSENQSHFMLYEVWSSKKTWEKHVQMPYFKPFVERLDKILVEPLESTFWKAAG